MKINFNIKEEKELDWKYLRFGSVVELIYHTGWTIKENLVVGMRYNIEQICSNTSDYTSFRVSPPTVNNSLIHTREEFKLIKI